MKKIEFISSFALALAVTALTASTPFAQDTQPDEVHVMPSTVFTPSGFDDNDNVEVVMDGTLPNTCYKVGPTKIKVDPNTRTISVSDTSYLYKSDFCLMMLVPYTKTLQLGVVPAGDYLVQFENQFGAMEPRGNIRVAKATTASADSFLYAPIEEAFIQDRSNRAAPTLVLRGHYPSKCMGIKQVRIIHEVSNVLELLPIAEVTAGKNCQPAPTAFEIKLNLSNVPKTTFLIHVRSLNGQALNVVVH